MTVTPVQDRTEQQYHTLLLWGLFVVLIALLFLVWLGSLPLGLVSDDYAHLVQDVNLPFWKGSDNLFRPLRNILLRDVLAPVFGTTPQPYHVLLLLLYSVTVLSVWWVTREFAGSFRAAIATLVFALFPRNYPLLFWVASSQDLIVIPLIIAAVVFWLRGRDLLALACYAIALGFKETAIICSALLVLADLTVKRDFRIRRYVPLAILTACYAVLIVASGQRNVAKSDGIYGLSLGAPLAEAREVANLALPFHGAFGLRDLEAANWLLVAGVLGAFALLTVTRQRRGSALFGIGWVLIALAPTSIFARTVNADHYLMFPLVGVAILIAVIIEKHETAAALAAIAFAIAGYFQLVEYRHKWRADSERVAALEREVHDKIRAPVDRITLVNLTHPGLANAVRGVVIEAGIPVSTPVRHNFASPEDKQEAFLKLLTGCRAEGSSDTTFLYDRGRLVDISGPCATGVVDRDVRSRPYAWF